MGWDEINEMLAKASADYLNELKAVNEAATRDYTNITADELAEIWEFVDKEWTGEEKSCTHFWIPFGDWWNVNHPLFNERQHCYYYNTYSETARCLHCGVFFGATYFIQTVMRLHEAKTVNGFPECIHCGFKW